MEEWNGIWKTILVWNGNFSVWNGYGMAEILQYGIWKNRLPFHSIACPAGSLLPKIYSAAQTSEAEVGIR